MSINHSLNNILIILWSFDMRVTGIPFEKKRANCVYDDTLIHATFKITFIINVILLAVMVYIALFML